MGAPDRSGLVVRVVKTSSWTTTGGRSSTSSCASRAVCLVAFDLLVLNGKDVRALPFVGRKKLPRAVVPQRSSTVLYAQHIHGYGCELFSEVCRQDLEGIVAKHHAGRYGEDEPTRWLKITDPEYS